MLCETTLETQPSGIYAQHKYVESVMKPHMTDGVRNYTWASLSETKVAIRCDTKPDALWRPVRLPKNGTAVRFTLDAHVRCWGRRDDRRVRVSNTRYMANLDWIDRKAPLIGLKLRGQDYDPIKVAITKGDRPFMMDASRFRGIAIITNAKLFADSLLKGIDNAKAFGFGFLNFTVLEG